MLSLFEQEHDKNKLEKGDAVFTKLRRPTELLECRVCVEGGPEGGEVRGRCGDEWASFRNSTTQLLGA